MTGTLDTALVDELRELMGEEFETLLDVYLSESRRLFGEVDRAWRAGDREALARSAHSLKGASANLGAVALAAVCADLEREAPDAAPEAITVRLQAAAAALDEAMAAVRGLRAA